MFGDRSRISPHSDGIPLKCRYRIPGSKLGICPHTFSSDRCLCNFYAASVTRQHLYNGSFCIYHNGTPTVLTWPENFLTEKSVLLPVSEYVVNGFRFRYLTSGPFSDLLRDASPIFDGIESHWLICFIWMWLFLPCILSLSYLSSLSSPRIHRNQ